MSKITMGNAKVMSKGQITLPKDIREALKLKSGDHVMLVYNNKDQVIMMNADTYASKAFDIVINDDDKQFLPVYRTNN